MSFVPEDSAFALVPTAQDLSASPERRLRLHAHREVDYNVQMAWLEGRTGGPAAPDWMKADYMAEGGADICRVGPVWWSPRYGALIDAEGRMPIAPVGAAHHNWPALDRLPGVVPDHPIPRFAAPRDAPRLSRATVAMPWGVSNYGHFMLDGLASVLAVEQSGLLAEFPLATPRLNRWQRALIAMIFPDLPVTQIAAPIAALDGAVFSSTMDHYLQTPGPLTRDLRERARMGTPKAERTDRKIYISRRSQHMRIMVDEPALEAALQARGFDIVRPERLSVDEQIRLFKEASVIVGASGAGLTNILFAPPGAKVIEIQPETFTSFWIPATCRVTGLDWSGYICRSPCPSTEAPWLRRIRRGFWFAYRLGVADFMAFLDTRL